MAIARSNWSRRCTTARRTAASAFACRWRDNVAAMQPTLTEHLARFIVQADRATMPLAVAQYYVLDWLGSALAGTQTPQGCILLDYAASQPTLENGCAIIGRPGAYAAEAAALVNGGLSHI